MARALSWAILAAAFPGIVSGDPACDGYVCTGGMLWCKANNGCFPPSTPIWKCKTGFFCKGKGVKGGGKPGARPAGRGGGSSGPAPPPAKPHVPKIVPPVPSQGTNSLNLFIIGDWGGSSDSSPTTPGQRAAAEGMAKVGAVFKPEFVLGLGDNIYGSGVKEHNQWRFKASFEDVYTHSSLQVPWYQTAGNHDWQHNNIEYQIQYSKKSHRWIFPSALYTFRRKLPTGETAKFIMFDHLAVSRNKPYGPLKGKKFDGVTWEQERRTDGFHWLEEELKASNDDYLFLIDHHPIYTVCSHGNTRAMQGVPDLMKKYGVTAFMSGHDHCMIHMSKEGQTYMLIGAASQAWNPDSKRSIAEAAGVKTHYALTRGNKGAVRGAFASMRLTSQNAVVQYYNDQGSIIHEIPLPRRGRSVTV